MSLPLPRPRAGAVTDNGLRTHAAGKARLAAPIGLSSHLSANGAARVTGCRARAGGVHHRCRAGVCSGRRCSIAATGRIEGARQRHSRRRRAALRLREPPGRWSTTAPASSTSDINELRLVSTRRQPRAAQLTATSSVSRRMAARPAAAGKDLRQWASSLALSRAGRAAAPKDWHAHLATLAPGSAYEQDALTAAQLFTAYLKACRDSASP